MLSCTIENGERTNFYRPKHDPVRTKDGKGTAAVSRSNAWSSAGSSEKLASASKPMRARLLSESKLTPTLRAPGKLVRPCPNHTLASGPTLGVHFGGESACHAHPAVRRVCRSTIVFDGVVKVASHSLLLGS